MGLSQPDFKSRSCVFGWVAYQPLQPEEQGCGLTGALKFHLLVPLEPLPVYSMAECSRKRATLVLLFGVIWNNSQAPILCYGGWGCGSVGIYCVWAVCYCLLWGRGLSRVGGSLWTCDSHNHIPALTWLTHSMCWGDMCALSFQLKGKCKACENRAFFSTWFKDS